MSDIAAAPATPIQADQIRADPIRADPIPADQIPADQIPADPDPAAPIPADPTSADPIAAPVPAASVPAAPVPAEPFLVSAPGVYRPQSDTGVLAGAIIGRAAARGRDVLDLGTGTGAAALAAAGSGARSVTAVDLSRRAVGVARLNARLHRVRLHRARLHPARVRVHHGDLFAPVRGRRFGLITANPPYVPSATDRLARHRSSRSWDGGRDGRLLVDRICDGAAEHLVPGGLLLLVHGGACGADRTLERLAGHGLTARVVERVRIPLGPVMRARAALHEARGLAEPGAVDEELVVIEASRAC